MSHNAQNTEPIDEALTGRYASTVGWDPNAKEKKREQAAQLKRAREAYQTREAMRKAIEVRPACEWLEYPEPQPKPLGDPFPPFWREGELAVLTGPSGVGKSLLAVQIAETLCGGRASLLGTPPAASGSASDQSPITHHLSPRPVLYLDLERTERQLTERYIHNGEKYDFSDRLDWGLLAEIQIPDGFKGGAERFFRGAIGEKLADTDAPVVIIDNLSWLVRSGTATEFRQLMKSFRRWVNATGRSLLLLHQAETPRRPRISSPPYEGGVPGRAGWFSRATSAMSEFADSIFALHPSTFAPDHRYIKQIYGRATEPTEIPERSDSSLIPHPSSLVDPVHVYKLERPANATAYGLLPAAFAFVGLSDKAAHTKDYAAEVAKFEAAIERAVEKEERRRKLSAKDALALGVIDGTYQRYLNGD